METEVVPVGDHVLSFLLLLGRQITGGEKQGKKTDGGSSEGLGARNEGHESPGAAALHADDLDSSRDAEKVVEGFSTPPHLGPQHSP